ncbi:hypothetical protein PUN28_016761 [Cardiocondyla obscurior]|uniref:Uncharacterized protein n=1 Tax=Cardiocondyla obscurior TaxID=286306 RepID=A0AAW2ERA6_9HYME
MHSFQVSQAGRGGRVRHHIISRERSWRSKSVVGDCW